MKEESSIPRLFLVHELLEATLLFLDRRTLLTIAPRVCRQWGDTIKNSYALQAFQFFAPIPDHGKSWKRVPNPLLANIIWPKLPQLSLHARSNRFAEKPLPSELERFFREEASWRQMLFQQPPSSGIGILAVGRWAIFGTGPFVYPNPLTLHDEVLRAGWLCDKLLSLTGKLYPSNQTPRPIKWPFLERRPSRIDRLTYEPCLRQAVRRCLKQNELVIVIYQGSPVPVTPLPWYCKWADSYVGRMPTSPWVRNEIEQWMRDILRPEIKPKSKPENNSESNDGSDISNENSDDGRGDEQDDEGDDESDVEIEEESDEEDDKKSNETYSEIDDESDSEGDAETDTEFDTDSDE